MSKLTFHFFFSLTPLHYFFLEFISLYQNLTAGRSEASGESHSIRYILSPIFTQTVIFKNKTKEKINIKAQRLHFRFLNVSIRGKIFDLITVYQFTIFNVDKNS